MRIASLRRRVQCLAAAQVRGWRKYKVCDTNEAVLGTVGALAARTAPFGDDGLLRYAGRTTPSPGRPAHRSPGHSPRRDAGHPCTHWSFSAGRGSRETLNVTFGGTRVVEVGVARDASGQGGHLARWYHASTGLSPTGIPRLTSLH